jgi:phosphoribosylamine-glycine ligase
MKKPTFLWINIGGDFMSLHQRVAEEGYQCFSWYDPGCKKSNRHAGKGMIEVIDDMYDVINKFFDRKDELIVIFDDNGAGDEADVLRKSGYKVIGTSSFADRMEHDRTKGNDLAVTLGLAIPKTYKFKDFGKAVTWASSQKEGTFYFKGDGFDMAGSSYTHFSKSPEDLVWYLEWIQKDVSEKGKTLESFEIQECVDGIEVDFGRWFDGEKFAPAIAIDFEQKTIHGLGSPQGCLGQIMTYVEPTIPFNEYFDRLEKILKKSGSGPNEWAANSIVSHKDNQPYFLEWTPRFGWDSTFGELQLIKENGKSIAEFFIRIAYGKPFPKDFFPIGRYSCAVRLFSESTGTEGKEVKGKPLYFDPEKADNFWWYGVRMHEDGRYEITGNPFGVAVATGDTPEEAMKNVYELIDPKGPYLSTPDLFYSECIGEHVTENMDLLKKMGVI